MPEQRVSILVYRPDGTLIAQYLLGDGEHLIGRDIHCPVYLNSEHISRNHAKLQLSHDGIQIEDLNSTAGTYLDGVAVRGKLRIKPGQRLQVGDLTVDLQLESEGQIGPGSRLGDGRYTLIRLLGRGGMGEVWLAKDEQLDEEVALKKLPPEVGADAMALADMRREVQKSRALSHPHIIRIHDLIQKSGEDPLISLEYVDGTDLTAIAATKTNGVFGWEEIVTLVLQLCDALQYAHEQKIVHRDLKPQNMMVNRKGELKLADFGIAATVADSLSRSSMQGFISGTTLYMSPQQMEGAAPQVTDDVYAFGATLYELLTSRAPFYTGDVQHQVLHVTPTPMAQRLAEFGFVGEIPPYVHELVMSCLSKIPESRPQNMKEVRMWIEGKGNSNLLAPLASTQKIQLRRESEALSVVSGNVIDVEPPPNSTPKAWKLVAGFIAVLLAVFVIKGTTGSKTETKHQSVNGHTGLQVDDELIPDLVLRKELAKILKVEEGKITPMKLSEITALSLSQKGVKSIQGLQHCSSLRSLNLYYNKIEDLSPIAKLHNLETLYLGYNSELEKLPDLSALKKVKVLSFRECGKLRDLRGLKEMIWLESLNLQQVYLSDISPLAGLVNLKSLNLYYNKIEDLSPIANMDKLEALSVSYNPELTKVPDLSALKKVKSLSFYQCGKLKDISGIKGMIWLESLGLGYVNLSDISPIAGLVNLKSLDLQYNKIEDLSPIVNMEKLETLTIHNNLIQTVPDLSKLILIKSLSFSNNRLRDISGLKAMDGLETLYLHQNPTLSDLTPLTGVKRLKELWAYSCKLTDISPLAQASNLKTLDLHSNTIVDITPIQELEKLETLNLSYNQIETVPDLSKLLLVRSLPLFSNNLKDLSGLGRMDGLETLDISGNPLLSELTPLSGLKRLKSLSVKSCKVVNTQPIWLLKNLKSLNIQGNSISQPQLDQLKVALPKCTISHN